jgi:hypothetical protein
MTKHKEAKPTSSFSGKKATLSAAPSASSGRWRDPRYASATGHAMKGGKFKGTGKGGGYGR